MTELSLYLASFNITVSTSAEQQNRSSVKEFECVELEDLEEKAQSKQKTPRRVIHFSSGETMEEYSTEEEEDDTEKHPEKKDLLSSVDTSRLTWGPYVWFQMWRAATSTVSACDYLGERMASLFGITSAKYQYAIDEYNRIEKESEEQTEESHLSQEAMCHIEKQHNETIKVPKMSQPESEPVQNSITCPETPSISDSLSVTVST